MHPIARLLIASALAAAAASSVLTSPAAAHADADVIAVAAGEEVTVNFRPNHGCGPSPTTEVAVRVPVAGATGGTVDGWTSTTAEDDEGRTVVEWTGGSLPTDVTGTFPVTFTAPDEVGELLLFPSVQVCENGEELSWVSGDPESANPAPRLLILAPGSEAAVSVDEVPENAPGRELLTAVIDTAPTPTTTAPPTTSAPTATTTSNPTTPTTESEPRSPDDAPDTGSDGGPPTAMILLGGSALALVAGFAYFRRKGK